jgi:hypothetical protein
MVVLTMSTLALECQTVTEKLISFPRGISWKLRVEEAAQMARCSPRTVYRHMPYFKTYLLTRPGKTRGNRLIDGADFCAYLEQRAQGLTNSPSLPLSQTPEEIGPKPGTLPAAKFASASRSIANYCI